MIVKTYEELNFFINMFKRRDTNLLVIESKPGTGKTGTAEEIMADVPYLKLSGHLTTLELFVLGYKFKNYPIIIDDIDLNNNGLISLMKMMCESKRIKEISYFSTNSLLQKENIPLRYETSSPILVLTNNFKELSEKIKPIKDRALHVKFRPTNEELLKKIEKIMPSFSLTSEEKNEIFQEIKKYSRVCDFSLRTFAKGVELYKGCKNRNVDWKSLFLRELQINEKIVLLDNILSKYDSEKDRLKAWTDSGYSRRSYYYYKKWLVQECKAV